MQPAQRISCIICAYNEAPRIQEVLRAAAKTSVLSEILVIDDGSTDGTSDVVRTVCQDVRQDETLAHAPPITLIRIEQNGGKSKAMASGVARAAGDLCMLLDADLRGITAAHITALAAPVLQGRVDVSVSLRKNSLRIYRLIGMDFVSGERLVPTVLLRDTLQHMRQLPRFGVEVFMNNLLIRQCLRIAVVDWPDVTQARKVEKMGFWRGTLSEMRMVLDIMRVTYPLSAVLQSYRMLRLLAPPVPASNAKNAAADASHE